MKIKNNREYIEKRQLSSIDKNGIKYWVCEDVAELIRCKDCKYCEVIDKYEFWCYGVGSPARLMCADDYCSRGERRDENVKH